MGIDSVSRPTRPLAGSLLGSGKKSIIAGVAAAVAAGVAPSAYAEIELGEGLAVTGFVDMSYVSYDEDGAAADRVFGVDQVEIDFLYTGSAGVSAQVDLEYNDSEGTFVEQAFITKALTEQFSVKVGRFLSYSGWETEEPTGLFQYSGTGYAPYFYGYYQQGVSAYYDGGKFAVMGSVVNDAFGYAGGPLATDTKSPGYEVGLALMPAEGFTAKAFYISDDKTDQDVINVWASYAVSNFTFAGEYNTADYAGGGDGDGFLLMANYASGPFGITLRYHDYDITGHPLDGDVKAKGFSLSPSYKVGDNLLLVAEFRSENVSGGPDWNAIALEALFTF